MQHLNFGVTFQATVTSKNRHHVFAVCHMEAREILARL